MWAPEPITDSLSGTRPSRDPSSSPHTLAIRASLRPQGLGTASCPGAHDLGSFHLDLFHLQQNQSQVTGPGPPRDGGCPAAVPASGGPSAPSCTLTFSELGSQGTKEILQILLPVWVQSVPSTLRFCWSGSLEAAIPPSRALEPKISPGGSPSRWVPPRGVCREHLLPMLNRSESLHFCRADSFTCFIWMQRVNYSKIR